MKWKTTKEIQECPDRCRVKDCRIPMSSHGHPGTCGHHKVDKPKPASIRR